MKSFSRLNWRGCKNRLRNDACFGTSRLAYWSGAAKFCERYMEHDEVKLLTIAETAELFAFQNARKAND